MTRQPICATEDGAILTTTVYPAAVTVVIMERAITCATKYPTMTTRNASPKVATLHAASRPTMETIRATCAMEIHALPILNALPAAA